jgi:transcriptional regulator with PAS, ATPase and Fis domain
MNKMKKKLCVIGLAEVVCDAIGASLRSLIGEYADILCWCLETRMDEQIPLGYDLYLATYPGSDAYARKMLPDDCQILLAGRFVNPSNFDRLLELPKNTRILAVDNSLERANYLIWEIARFGVNHLAISPYYPDCPEPEKMAQSFAVGAGRKRNVPDWMEFINLGVKELTITTYARILQILDIPEEVLDSIVHTYMDSVFQMARRNNNIRTYLNSIINNIDEIIFGIDESGGIFFKNNAAENLIASLGKASGVSLGFRDIFSELERPFSYYCENCEEEIITKINGLHYVLQIKPVSEPIGGNIGTLIIVKPVTRVQELENKVRRKLKGTGLTAKYTFANILGASPAIRQAVETARKFAGTPLTVLLESESGTGKELFAQSIHQASACASGPFVAFNFSALPETLAESELFGYEEGAFTGARRGGKPGLFEQAHNGTIFLDELGSASLAVQARLLRVLEEREVRRIGGERVLPVSVRVIAATNEDLSAMVRNKQFRNDLFYRLCICPLYIPPLRERTGDVLFLVKHFAETLHSRHLKFDSVLEDFCNTYDWPGNVRELQNMVTYLCAVVPPGRVCTTADLPRYFHSVNASSPAVERKSPTFTDVYAEMVAGHTLDICTTLLVLFSEKTKGHPLGREHIFDLLKDQYPAITHPALRRHLDTLKYLGMLHSGSTKQGTDITPSGRDFLAWIHQRSE